MRMTIPKLRMWHLLGLVAAIAAYISVFQFRTEVDDPGYRWMRRLRASSAADRAEAAGHLGQINPRDRRAIGPLTEALFDPDGRVVAAAARALFWIVPGVADPESGTVKAALTSAFAQADRDPAARLAIARAMANLKPEPGVFIPALLGFAKDGDAKVRAEALEDLGTFARESEPARAALIAGLRDKEPEVRMTSARTLGSCLTYPTPVPRAAPGDGPGRAHPDGGTTSTVSSATRRSMPWAVSATRSGSMSLG